MSWSEIKKKKEEEEKKKKSTNTSDSTVKQISNVVTGNLWKNIGQNIITSQKNAEARKQREEEFKRKLNVTQNIPISQKTTTNTKREIKPSVIQSYANNYNSSNKNGNTWEQIKNIVNNRNIMTLANKDETKNATEITSSDIDAMRESNEFNRIMQNGTRKEQIDAVIGHFGNSIIGGAKQTIGGIGNVGTTLGATAVKSARNMARLGKNEKLAEKLDTVYNKIVDKGRDINDRATYFNKVNSRIDNNTVRTVTGATNTVANVATNAFLSAGTGGGTVLQGLQVGGSSAQEVLNENKNNIGKATTTGIAKGITSYLTEKMFDANILTKGAEKSSIQKLVNNKIESKIKSQLGRNIADKATGIIGENLEEIVEDNVGNLIDRVVNNKKLPEWKEWLNNTSETIKATTLSTAILNLVGLGGDNNQDIEADLRNQNASEQDIQKAKEFVRAVTQENIQSQNTDNQVINQETKTSQNGFSEAEKTETLRQEARNKLESIKQNYDENSYNQMQEFIETAPSEKALNQVISDLNKEAETKQVAPLKQKQEVQLPMKQQETQNKSFEDVAFDAMSNYESNEVESPLKNRDMSTIGKQTNVNAYQYDNPKVKPYFQEMAQQMGEDLAYISSSDNRSTQKGGGTKLNATTKAMDILHNEQGYSYNQIAQGLQNIIDDKGSENNAISKKIELVIDEQLRNGYTNALGKYVEPNQEYINTIQGNKEVQLPMKQKQEVSLPLNENVVNNQETSQEQYSLTETQPQNNFKYEQTDNEKVNKLYESTSKYFDDSQKTHNMLKPMEKIVRDKGYNIVFDDTLGDNINGRIRTNQDTGETEITINPNSSRKGEFIIGHELTHAIETQEMVDLVKKRMEKDGELRNAVEDLKKLYGTDDINGEVLADISGQLFGNQEFINNLSVEKPNVFKRIYDTIVSLANKITGNSSEALFLKDLKNKWEKAYRENTNNIKEPQYSIGGEKSLNADIKKLNEAKNLKDKGVSDQDIYKQTGWYKSVDGKWKYEIDDSDFNIKDVKIEPNETYELNEILDAPELFEAYPKLKNILVSFDDIQNKGEQYSRMGYEYITINNDLINNHSTINDYELLGIKNQSKVYSTLMHEIQHVIQDYEKFAKGASIDFWSDATKDINRKYEWTQRDYKHYKEEIGLDKYEEKLFKDFKNKKITGSELVDSIDAYIDKKGYTEKFERLAKLQQDLLNKKYKLEDTNAGSLYYFTAGEIEAREVQNRINKDSKWKKENIPTELAGAVFAEDYTDNPNIRNSLSENATNLPEVKEGYTRLYRGLESEYNPQYDKNKLDNVNGYESWTDDYDLAKSYGNNVYYIDIPTSEIKNSIIDEDSTSKTYGDRNLIYKNDKPVGINGKSGNEYMLYTEHDNYKNIKYNKTNNQATAQDNQGNKLNPNMQKWAKDSKARVDSDGNISEDGKLATVYHTTTDTVAQFNEFNPVGTPYYRFGDQVVNYYTDSKEMSGSYANQEYKQADTKRLNSIDDVNNYLNSLNKNNNNGNVYNLQKINNKNYVIETSEIDKKALNFLNSLSENELNQMKDSIYTDEKMKGTPYEKVFNWVNFDKELNNKYKKLTDEYTGTDNLVDIQKRMINYLENPNLYNENKAYNGNLVGSYDSDNEMFRNLKQDIQKTDWTNNSKIQYEGYVNITNPYIIDAEERNWNQVVQQSNDFIDELDERVPSDIKNKLVWLYVKSENLSSDLRAEYEKYQKTIEDIGNTASDFSDDTRHMNHLIRRLGLDEMNNLYEGNYNALKLNDWNVVADVLQTDGVIGSATANFITNEWRLPEQIKNWINTEYTKKLNLKDASNLKELYEKNAKAYEEFSKYRYPQDYFIEKISGDPDSEGFVNLGEELEEMFEERAEMMGADEVGRELAQAASVSFSKPELIRLWGTSKTTNDIVKEIIASNQDGKTNYDGLIIKNVYDYGGKSQSKEPANLYVTFNSNQFKAIDNENPTSDPDIRYSKQNNSWQDYLEKNYKSEGTTTDLRDIRLPMKEKQEVKLPMKQENTQQTQEQNNNTKGENINWTEIERPEENRKFRKHYKSIIESDNTTAEAKAVAKELMGTDTYTPETNKGQLAQADQRIMTSSPEVELQALRSRVLNGERITSVDIAVGERLIQYFSKTGSAEQLQDAIQTTALAGTSTGQTLQALTILNHQTPQGQVTWLQRSIDKMNKELAKKKGGTITTDADGNIQIVNKQGKDITNKVDLFNLTPEMMNKIMQSENQEQMLQNIDEVYEELGQQVPKGMLEKIDSWRYFSMLANIRTHGRNMIGNFAMGKMQRVKDKIAGGIEDVVSKFNPEMERTKTLRRADKKTKEFAKNDFKNVEVQSRLELNESKFNPQSRLQNARRTFKSNAMENTLGRLFSLNDKLLSAEDGIGLKAGYQKALADYITANKIDVDNITDAQLNKARNYAVQQAKEATFHQANAIASAVAQFENKNLATKLFTGAVLPFKKTPMNVAKAGMEYSPLQIAKSATVDLVNLRKGNISVNQYIDNLSKGMTGTGIALVGYALANAGILKASGGDDKDKEKYEEEQGKQSYSIQIAGKTYSLDWLAPTGIPLFIGAETHKLFNQEETEKSTEKKSEEDRLNQAIKGASNLLNAGATAINPMSEMSMISGLTSALSSYNTSDNLGSLGNIMTNAGKSYVNQFFPTLMGQVAKTGDEYERTTKSTAKGTIVKAFDQTKNQIMNKIPGLRQKLPIKTDIWGKDVKQEVNLPLRAFNNFINPATVKEVSTDKVDMELNKLYEENRNSDLLPDILQKKLKLNGTDYRWTNKEYAEYTKKYGQTSYNLINDFIKTSDYRNLTQEQKENVISNIYSYAKEKNKLEYAKKVDEEVKPSTLYTTMETIKKDGGKQIEYLNYASKTKGMSKESEKNKVLANSNYSNKTKEIIYTNGTGKDDNLYNNLLSKSNINMTEYLNYKSKITQNTNKEETLNYLNKYITKQEDRLLIASKKYSLQNSEKQKLAEYINQIASTKEERLEIYKQLDKNFTIKDGKVYMRVSK